MQPRRSNLPWIFLLLFPLIHVFLVGSLLPSDQQAGYWQITATVLFLLDGFLALVLIYLLYGSISWKTREHGLVALGVLPLVFGIISVALGGTEGIAGTLASNGVALLVIALCWFWLRKQKHLQDH